MEVMKKYIYVCISSYSCLDEHLALGTGLYRGAVDRHGLAVTRELQSELLLHQLPDHLLDEKEGEKSSNINKKKLT